MARQMNQALWDQWRQRLRGQRESGLSIAAFCRRENLSPHGFHVWRRKLRKATAGQHASRRAAAAQPSRRRQGVVLRRRRPAKATAAPRRTGFLQLPVASTQPSPWTELMLADGTVVRLPQQNVAALLAVLRLLRGEPVDLIHAEHGGA
jgi:hypothetical protein